MMIVWKKAKVLPVLIKPLPSINQWIKTWEKSLGKILSDQLITHAQTIISLYLKFSPMIYAYIVHLLRILIVSRDFRPLFFGEKDSI